MKKKSFFFKKLKMGFENEEMHIITTLLNNFGAFFFILDLFILFYFIYKIKPKISIHDNINWWIFYTDGYLSIYLMNRFIGIETYNAKHAVYLLGFYKIREKKGSFKGGFLTELDLNFNDHFDVTEFKNSDYKRIFIENIEK